MPMPRFTPTKVVDEEMRLLTVHQSLKAVADLCASGDHDCFDTEALSHLLALINRELGAVTLGRNDHGPVRLEDVWFGPRRDRDADATAATDMADAV